MAARTFLWEGVLDSIHGGTHGMASVTATVTTASLPTAPASILPFAADGMGIHALISQEWEGPLLPGICHSRSDPKNRSCWFGRRTGALGGMNLGLGARQAAVTHGRTLGAISKSPDFNKVSPLELLLSKTGILVLTLTIPISVQETIPSRKHLRFTMENPVPNGICLLQRPTQLGSSKEPEVELLPPTWKVPSPA